MLLHMRCSLVISLINRQKLSHVELVAPASAASFHRYRCMVAGGVECDHNWICQPTAVPCHAPKQCEPPSRCMSPPPLCCCARMPHAHCAHVICKNGPVCAHRRSVTSDTFAHCISVSNVYPILLHGRLRHQVPGCRLLPSTRR